MFMSEMIRLEIGWYMIYHDFRANHYISLQDRCFEYEVFCIRRGN